MTIFSSCQIGGRHQQNVPLGRFASLHCHTCSSEQVLGKFHCKYSQESSYNRDTNGIQFLVCSLHKCIAIINQFVLCREKEPDPRDFSAKNAHPPLHKHGGVFQHSISDHLFPVNCLGCEGYVFSSSCYGLIRQLSC